MVRKQDCSHTMQVPSFRRNYGECEDRHKFEFKIKTLTHLLLHRLWQQAWFIPGLYCCELPCKPGWEWGSQGPVWGSLKPSQEDLLCPGPLSLSVHSGENTPYVLTWVSPEFEGLGRNSQNGQTVDLGTAPLCCTVCNREKHIERKKIQRKR